MNGKEDVVYTVDYYLLQRNLVIRSNMDGFGRNYAKWNKSIEENNTVWYHLYVESKQYNKLMNKTGMKQTHRYREETSG